MTPESHVTFCFLPFVCRKNLNQKTSYIINKQHPSTFYQFPGLALASLQAIRARVKCFFPFFLLFLSSSPLSLSLPLLTLSACISCCRIGVSWLMSSGCQADAELNLYVMCAHFHTIKRPPPKKKLS